jgi:hypothetical protein
MAVKLVALDLDDTLLDEARLVSDRAKQAIRGAVAKGVTVIIATGRMYRSALPYALQLDLDVPLITYNGALVKCSMSGETLLHRPVDAATAAQVLELFRQRGWYIQVYRDDQLYVRERDENARYYEYIADVDAIPVGDRLYDAVETTKLLAMDDPASIPEIYQTVEQAFGDKLYLTISKPNYLEILNPKASKGLALAYLAERLGIDRSEVMAVGDSLNDLDMIEYAGLGVAMGNSRPEVKAAAQAVTAGNDADGVAEAIEKYVLRTSG